MARHYWVMVLMLFLGACTQLLQQNGLVSSTAEECATQGKQLDQATGECLAKASTAKPRAHVAARPTASGPGVDPVNAIMEPDATLDDTLKDDTKLISGLVGLVRANSYRCDAISAVKPFDKLNGFRLACDHFRYKYAIEDRGGRWMITVE